MPSHILQMSLVGPIQCLVDHRFINAKTALATTLVDQQIGIFTRCVAPQIAQALHGRERHPQCRLVLTPATLQPCQAVGNTGIDPHALIVGGVFRRRHAHIPIEFGHALLHQTVIGIAQPVTGLTLREQTVRLETIGQRQYPVVVPVLIG